MQWSSENGRPNWPWSWRSKNWAWVVFISIWFFWLWGKYASMTAWANVLNKGEYDQAWTEPDQCLMADWNWNWRQYLAFQTRAPLLGKGGKKKKTRGSIFFFLKRRESKAGNKPTCSSKKRAQFFSQKTDKGFKSCHLCCSWCSWQFSCQTVCSNLWLLCT